MESLTDMMAEDRQKKLLYGVLRDLIPGMVDNEYAVLIDRMLEKMEALQAFSLQTVSERSDELRQAAIDTNTDEDTMLGYLVYFMVMLENVLLKEEVDALKSLLG